MELSETLVPGQSYCGEMYVSLAESPKYASNNLGMYLSDHLITAFDLIAGSNGWWWYGIPIPVQPQIVEHSVILDSTNWVRISGVFTAGANDRYVIVGNFSDDANTNVIDKGGHWPDNHDHPMAYYFVDDISIVPYSPKVFQITAPPALCQGDSINVVAEGDLLDVAWTTLEDTVNIIATGKVLKTRPLETTHYRVKGRNCKYFVKDTVTVFVNPRPISTLGTDTTLCKGTFRELHAGGEDGDVYAWNNGSHNESIIISSQGEYSVTIKNQYGCQQTDAIRIREVDTPKFDLGRDTVVCEPYTLTVAKDTRYFSWSTGSLDSTITIYDPGEYWLRATNECGSRSDTVLVHSFNRIFAPNVVTLNNDEWNNHFSVYSSDKSAIFSGELSIYNRHGDLVFESPQYFDGWPVSSNDLSSGVYYYKFRLPGCPIIKGIVNVLK
jgi:hypothetical protein